MPYGLPEFTLLGTTCQCCVKVFKSDKCYVARVPSGISGSLFLDVARPRSDARPDFRSAVRAKRAHGGGSREGGRATSRKDPFGGYTSRFL
eukprot:689948-Prorocentrum_minimum.AAC.5